MNPTAALMVRPACFGFNDETAASNAFQNAVATPAAAAAPVARQEFDAAVSALRGAGVRICVVDDTPVPTKPDAVFPNNWVSFHGDGTLVQYPMLAPNRRLERREAVITQVQQTLGFQPRRVLDWSHREAEGRYLEGTGSLVLDHSQRRVFAAVSPRTDEQLVRQWAQTMDFEPVIFRAHGPEGAPVYHTNVVLAIGERWAVVAADAITASDRAPVLDALACPGRDIVCIGTDAMQGFAANILELGEGRRVLALSHSAQQALVNSGGDAWPRLCAAVDTYVSVVLPTIETIGGGSMRCMLAEVPV